MSAAGPITLLGVPFDRASSYARGPAEAPAKIREALACASSNTWSELGVDVARLLDDAGDVAIPDDASARDVVDLIDSAAEGLLARGARPLSLGGDHSVTYPLVRAAARHHPGLTIIHFDAHPDLYDEFEGDRFSHACPFARIMEAGLATRLIQIGIRTAGDQLREQARRFGVETIEMRDWRGTRDLSLAGPLYVSVDLDVLDPAFAPGISHPEPGGCSVRQLVDALHALDAPIVAADVVEYNPRLDVRGLTGMVAAKIVKELTAVADRSSRDEP